MAYYISRYSEAEYEANEESGTIYGLPAWKQVHHDELCEDAEHYRLTTKGEEYVDEYQHDYSAGYDLCNGRLKGLAAEYTMEKFWDIITKKSDIYIAEYDNDKELFDKIQEMCNQTFTDLYWNEDGVLAYIVPDYERVDSDLVTFCNEIGINIADEPTVRMIDGIETETYNLYKA